MSALRHDAAALFGDLLFLAGEALLELHLDGPGHRVLAAAGRIYETLPGRTL
jgi:hypothetical protein